MQPYTNASQDIPLRAVPSRIPLSANTTMGLHFAKLSQAACHGSYLLHIMQAYNLFPPPTHQGETTTEGPTLP